MKDELSAPGVTLRVTIELRTTPGGAAVAAQDITAYVLAEDGVEITYSAPDKPGIAEPSRAVLTLDNRDGRFSPRNPRGPWFGRLIRGAKIRVYASVLGDSESLRFTGRVLEWPVAHNNRGLSRVRVTAYGATSLLPGAEDTAEDPWARAVADTGNAVGYWPLTTYRGKVTPATIGSSGYATYYGNSIEADTCDHANSVRTIAAYPRFSTTMPVTGVSGSAFSVRFITHPHSSDKVGLINFQTPQGNFTVTVGMGDSLFTLTAGDQGGMSYAFDISGVSWYSLNINADSFPDLSLPFLVQVDVNGLIVTLSVYQQGAAAGPTVSGSMNFTGHPIDSTLGPISSVSATAWGPLGHISVHSSVISLFDGMYQFNGYELEDAQGRAERISEDIGFTLGYRYTLYEGTQPMASESVNEKASERMRDCAAALDGWIAEQRTGDLLLVSGKYGAQFEPNATDAQHWSFGDGSRFKVTPLDDIADLVNQVAMKAPDGSTQVGKRERGALAVSAVGVHAEEGSATTYSTAQALALAQRRAYIQSSTEERYSSIRWRLSDPYWSGSAAANARRAFVVGMLPGDLIALTDLPSFLPPAPAVQQVMSLTETITPRQWEFEAETRPARPLRGGAYGAARYSPSGCTLTSAVTASQTSLPVTSSGVGWTTTAAALPFQIMCGGERMNVTAVSGSGLSQTLTVTRGMDGWAGAFPAGTPLELADINRWSAW